MTHESLLTHLTLYYETLAVLRYIAPSDILPPPTLINTDAATEAGLSPEAVAVLQKLPQLNSDLSSLPLFPDGSQPVFYIDDNLNWARRPTYQDEPEISEHAFVLSNPNIYGTSLIYDTVSAKLLPWEAWGKHVDLEIAEVENPFEMDDARPTEEIIGPWIAKLLALGWVPFGEELITEPEEDEVVSAKDDVDNLAWIQLRFVKLNLKEIYKACGWNDKAKELSVAKSKFDGGLFEIKKQEWMEHTQTILDQAYQEQWEWPRIRTVLNLVASDKVTLLDDCLPEGQQMRHIEL
jgi:hypothetical protein